MHVKIISVTEMFALRINRAVLHATAQQQVLLEIIARPVIQFLKISRFYLNVTKSNLTKKTLLLNVFRKKFQWCINSINLYSCDLDPCENDKCNGNVCTPDKQGGVTCDCSTTGFTGDHCETGNTVFENKQFLS